MKLSVAVFDPILPHYRAALTRELRSSRRFEFMFYSDLRDIEGEIPVVDKSDTQVFVNCSTVHLPMGLRWQSNTFRTCLSGRYAAVILPGNARWLSSWVGAAVARLTGKRVLLWTHGWTKIDHGLRKIARLAFYRLAHGLLLYGNRARDIGISLGLNAERLHVMYNSLDVNLQKKLVENISAEERRSIRTQIFGEPDTPVVLISGRLTTGKRFDLAIHAMAIVNRRFRRANLLVIGEGPERALLRALSETEEVNTRFIGACYDERTLAKYYSCASLTLSPGNVGLTCVHSMGYGVPVLTHGDPSFQNPEFEAIEPGRNGDLFEQNNLVHMAERIAAWTIVPFVEPSVAEYCISTVEDRYSPEKQREAIERALGSF